MKKFLILFSLIIISAGLIASYASRSSKNDNAQQDTTIIVKETLIENVNKDTVSQTQEEPSKSSILINKEKTGFSFITILRGLLGMLVLVFIAWLFSANRRNVDWFVIAKGLAIQVLLAICILYLPFVAIFFEFVGKMFVKILDFTKLAVNFCLVL
jgi:concentrative nucleoside transporter, CNT family